MSFASACENLLRGVPDYPCFLTVDELEAATDGLARAHPDAVHVTELGRSRGGRPVRCLTVGAGECAAAALGAPHPNEPVGVMTVSYLAERLAADPGLAAELGVTWHLVKAWDIDGLALNEGWLKGPYTLFDYARHYFRPDFADQPDWTFPVRHKRLAFNSPTPEAACGMLLIDEARPDLLLSLHNCSFGGAYWYETEPTPALWEPLRDAARRRGVPLDLSTPEMPYAKQLAPAVLGALGAEDAYDYYESLGAEDPAALVGHGTTSAAYAARRHGTFGLVCEIPYFYDRAIEDGSGCGRALSEVLLARLDWVGACGRLVEGWMGELGGVLGEKNPYRRALAAESFAASDAALRRQARDDPAFAREATVAEAFDADVVRRFYRSRNVGMLLSAIDWEASERRLSSSERVVAAEVGAEAESWLREACADFEARSSYRAIPIRDLVATQLESALLAVAHVRGLA